jgi:hypothetical protein
VRVAVDGAGTQQKSRLPVSKAPCVKKRRVLRKSWGSRIAPIRFHQSSTGRSTWRSHVFVRTGPSRRPSGTNNPPAGHCRRSASSTAPPAVQNGPHSARNDGQPNVQFGRETRHRCFHLILFWPARVFNCAVGSKTTGSRPPRRSRAQSTVRGSVALSATYRSTQDETCCE